MRLRSCKNPAKFTKTYKILQNSVEILSNTCLYNKFETYLSYWGYLLSVNLPSYLEISSLKVQTRSYNYRRRLCCEKLGTSHDVKGFAIGSFLEHIVGERPNDDLWSAKNWVISSEICAENNHKISHFVLIAFRRSLPRKFPWNRPIFPQISPQKSLEIRLFFSWPIRSPAVCC